MLVLMLIFSILLGVCYHFKSEIQAYVAHQVDQNPKVIDNNNQTDQEQPDEEKEEKSNPPSPDNDDGGVKPLARMKMVTTKASLDN